MFVHTSMYVCMYTPCQLHFLDSSEKVKALHFIDDFYPPSRIKNKGFQLNRNGKVFVFGKTNN
jgi:hypothetical protein